MGDWRDIGDGPLAEGTLFQMVRRQGDVDTYQMRVWLDGSLIIEGHGVTAVGAVAGISEALRELERTGELEAPILRELRGLHAAVRRQLIQAAVRDRS